MATNYRTFRLSDDSLVKALVATVNKLEMEAGATLVLNIDEKQPKQVQCEIQGVAEHKDIQQIVSYRASVVSQADVTIPEPYKSRVIVKREQYIDSVSINMPQNLTAPLAAKIVAVTQMHLKPYERDESFDKLLGDELSEFYRKREAGLIKLEEFTQKLIEQNEAYRRKIDEETDKERTSLHQNYEQLKEELNNQYDEKAAKLKDREESLEARVKDLDDRSSRHARRQIRKDLKEAIAQRGKVFSLTKKTSNKRNVIHALFVILIGFLGYIVYLAVIGQLSSSGGSINLYYYFKLPAASIATVAAIIYYIRWNDHWFKRHADEEFKIKRFELDIDRASWIVEMAMEWKDEEGAEIPKELIDRLTTNLFEITSEESPPRHPSEDLASALLGASNELSLNVPGVGNIKLDRKGTRQFKHAIEKAE